MLTLSVGYIHTRANETEVRYTGTYDTEYVRQLWAHCYNAALQKRMHPGAATSYCDCIIDTVRKEHTRKEVDNMTGRVEAFTGYANECGIRLFGPAPTGVPDSLTHARKLPVGSMRWLESLYFNQTLYNSAIPRVQEG
tara:strand:- start:66 stop:479 length:414 start_codon:yes stop_codon:yes gene_type:complete